MFPIESKTGIFNTLKKQPQNDKNNVRKKTGISSHRRSTDSQEYFHICAPSSKNKSILSVPQICRDVGESAAHSAMCGDVGPLTSHRGECELVQSFWIEGSLTMCSTSLENSPFDPGIPLLGSYPEETFGDADSDLYSRVLTTALFMRAKNGKQHKCLTTGESYINYGAVP